MFTYQGLLNIHKCLGYSETPKKISEDMFQNSKNIL